MTTLTATNGNPFEDVLLEPLLEDEPINEAQTSAAEVAIPHPVWRRDSVIVLIGTTNRGKTTTMNLFTGNKAEARGGAGATTTETKLYTDINPLHQFEVTSSGCAFKEKSVKCGYPPWLDTIGLQEARRGRQISDADIIQGYLKVLHNSNIKHIHAVIWCMQPEEAQTRALEEEAAAIKILLENCKSASVGANIIFLVKEPRDTPLRRTSRDVQGALECLEPSWRSLVQFEGYELEREGEKENGSSNRPTTTREEARERLETRLSAIQQPLQINWQYSVCLDCGQTGDGRLFENSCHLEKEKVNRFKVSCLNTINCCFRKKAICTHCRKPWSKQRRNGTVVAKSPRCIQISDFDNLKEGLQRCPGDPPKRHNLKELAVEQKEKFEKKRQKEARKSKKKRKNKLNFLPGHCMVIS